MSIELKVPDLPESVADATVLAWRKSPGEPVERDETVVDIETDKVVLEVPAPAAGVLGEIVEAEGATVRAGQVLGYIGEASTSPSPPAPLPSRDERNSPSPLAGERLGREEISAPALSPSVRRLVAEHDLDPAGIPATGKGGRLLKEDVLRHLEAQRGGGAESLPLTPGPSPARGEGKKAEGPSLAAGEVPATGRPERRERMSRLRARVAERLVEAQRNAAILTTFNEVDMSAVMDLRARHRESFEKRHGVKFGIMSLFVRAVAEALRRFPEVNASIDSEDVVYHGYYDIGIAVSSPRGLVVPILRDANRMSIAEIERTIAGYAAGARDGTLAIEDITGGTFTISNGGVFGSMLSTPIVNPPQSAILGLHRIQDRPVAVNGEVIIRPMMYLALSYDHRLIDGREAVSFLVAVKETIEAPERLLLGI